MNVLVAGFLTIDSIQVPTRQVTSVGGPPAYAGLICARFGHSVAPVTKVGTDFPNEQAVWLARNGVPLRALDRSMTKPTTRFRITNATGNRGLTLAARCEDLTPSQIPPGARFNAALVSPLAGEISPSLLGDISEHSDFTFLDPQGFVREFGADGSVTPAPIKEQDVIRKADALKMDRTEAEMITGKNDPQEAMARVSAAGVRKAIITQGGGACYVLDGTRVYRVDVPKTTVVDSTGAGDILSGATLSWYLKTRDFLRSACFGIAASSLSLHMIALAKVDLPMSVDESAARLYSSASPVASV